MKRTLILGVVTLLTASTPLYFAACERTVEQQTKTSSGPGGTQTETKKVVEHPNGTVTEQHDKTTTNNNP